MSRVSYNVKVNGEKQRITVNTNTGNEHLHETLSAPKKTLSNTQKEKLKKYGLNFSLMVYSCCIIRKYYIAYGYICYPSFYFHCGFDCIFYLP